MISVIVPLYKGKKYVSSIVSLVENEYDVLNKYFSVNVELIFVNDYPEEIIDCPYSKLIKIKLINQLYNSGIQNARVSGLELAEGEYIHFLDQDDRVENKFLLKTLKCMQEVGADVCVGNGDRIFLDKKIALYKSIPAMNLIKNKKMYIYGTDMIFSPGQCLIRKDSIPDEWKRNIMNQNGCDDFFLWLIMFSKHCQFCICSSSIYHHIENGDNYSSSKEKMNLSFEEMINLLDENKLLSFKEVKTLKHRLQIKKAQLNHKKIQTIFVLMRNPLIVWYTLIYKLMGYH